MDSQIPARPELGDVVVGVDGSPSARTTAHWAAAEADLRGRPLHLVHAADSVRRSTWTDADTIEALRDAGRELLTETASAVQERFPDLTVTKKLSGDTPVGALRTAAGDTGTIVVGHRGLGGFPALLLGSVGLGVAARTQVPVIVVRGESEQPGTGVVTAAVHEAGDLDWLLVAAAEAEARKATLRLVSAWNVLTHVGSVVTMLDDLDALARQRTGEVKALAAGVAEAYPHLNVTHHVETGTSTPGTLIGASGHTDLIVMGRGRRLLGVGPSLGRVAHALLHHAHCPVQIVSPPE
ncbi:universal stress protein [Streptomyces cavernicola]|uniref:Universal stress protein n=1 Tax=Streptomyces cavernicola TaxID=3043613 RepID=A0ABT6SHH4_9ACTN|nr:universal stress protein [Streptomyces sp. B-S-A6]MDI3406868.1 universal stress protein [Streptomyces sp. B-S-A6]